MARDFARARTRALAYASAFHRSVVIEYQEPGKDPCLVASVYPGGEGNDSLLV